MSTYSVPIKEMLFVLNELADLPEISQLQGYEEATPDTIEAILNEASSLAQGVLAPLNKSGDTQGCKIKDHKVIAADGFVDAYLLFKESGWQGLSCTPDYGGQGLPQVVAVASNEIWHSANMAFALCPMLTEGTVVALEAHATDELKAIYLHKLVSAEWTGTMNLTEPQAGSDLAAVNTKAIPNGDHYLITGQKIFITWGDQDLSDNIIHMVLARLPDAPPGIKGISLFLVPKYLVNDDGSLGERNDVYPISIEHKLGIHASPTCMMSYGDDQGATAYLVGEENNGIACMFTMMNHARLAVGMQGLSISERAYQQALAYAKDRIQGTIPGEKERVTIIHHPDVRRMLMIMKSGTEAMRALCYVTAASLDYIHHTDDEELKKHHTERFALLTPVVKGWCTELAQELTSLGIQVHGGMGYVEETGAAQHFRDARIINIYEGTTGIQAQDLVNRKIIRDNGMALNHLLEEMNETKSSLENSDDKHIEIIHNNFVTGISALQEATEWLLNEHHKNINLTGAVSFNYLMLMGTVCGGWQMAHAALIAKKILDSNPKDKSFYEAKVISSRFFSEHILSRASAYLNAIMTGYESVMALEIDQF